MQKQHALVTGAVALLIACALGGGCASVNYKQGRPEVYKLDHIKRVAVLPFGNDEFTDNVTEVLVNSSKWRVIDRATLQRILREQDLQHSERFDKDTAVRIGKLAGVNAVVFGEYEGRRSVVKTIDVETGEYLVYKNVDLSQCGGVAFAAWYSCQYLVPYAIRIQDGRPVRIWCGHNVDTKDPKTLTTSD